MTGPYSSFKGKLKVGDRVRCTFGDNVAVTHVGGVTDYGFMTQAGFYCWDWQGTLELLAPSPVVAEEDMIILGTRVITDPSMKPGEWHMEKGVITSNPPVEDSDEPQEWWFDREYWLEYISSEANPDVHKIVAEAERRGRAAAWLEAIKTVENDRCLQHMCRETRDKCECQTQAVVMCILTRMYEKAKEASEKPVTDGE